VTVTLGSVPKKRKIKEANNIFMAAVFILLTTGRQEKFPSYFKIKQKSRMVSPTALFIQFVV